MSSAKAPMPQIHHDEIDAVRKWVARYGSHAVSAALVILIALTALHLFNARHRKRTAAANLRMSTARSIADYESILSEFGRTGIAPMAMLSLAKLHFDNGGYEAALQAYSRFLADWPQHPMATTAQLGRVFCMEAQGHEGAIREALAGFTAFAAQHPQHYLAPQAVLGQARSLEQLGEGDAALTLYEAFIAAHPDNPWALRAEELMTALQRRLTRRDHAVPDAEDDGDAPVETDT